MEIALALTVVLVLLIIYTNFPGKAWHIIKPTEVGFVITAGNIPDPNDSEAARGPGLIHTLPWLERVVVFPSRSKVIPFEDMEVGTKDGFNVPFNNARLTVQIDEKYPQRFYLAFEGTYGKNGAATDAFNEAGVRTIGFFSRETLKMSLDELQSQLKEVAIAVQTELQTASADWGVTSIEFEPGEPDIPPEVEEAAAKLRMATADAEATRIQAEADAVAIERKATAEAASMRTVSTAEVDTYREQKEVEGADWGLKEYLQMLKEFALKGTPPPFQTILMPKDGGGLIGLIKGLVGFPPKELKDEES